MNDLIIKTNEKLNTVVSDLYNLKSEYENDIIETERSIKEEHNKVEKYKSEFNEAKLTIEKMTKEIEEFETDYQNLVDKFKDDELANILIAANREISLKIDERKKHILKNKENMNDIVSTARKIQKKLVKLNAEKKMLEDSLEDITKIYNYYNESIDHIIDDAKSINKNEDTKSTSKKANKKDVKKDNIDEEIKDNEFEVHNIEVVEDIKQPIEIEIAQTEEIEETEFEPIEEDNVFEETDYDKALEDILNYDDSLEEK